MISTRSIFYTSVTVMSVLTLGASAAIAGGFALREQSAIGTGMSFAGAGTSAYGLSGMFWNPAAVNTVAHFGFSSNFSFIAPYAKMTAQPGTWGGLGGSRGRNSSGNIGLDALVPASYGAYRLSPDWAIGVAITAPFGLATKPRKPWRGDGFVVTAKNMFVNADVVLGYRVNDWLSIAAGPSIMYGKARFTRQVLAGYVRGEDPGTASGLKDWGFGFVAGATVKPWQGGEISLGYRSAVGMNLKGRLSAHIPLQHLDESQPATTKLRLPDMVTIGLSQELTPQWKVLASVEWKNWSRVQNIRLVTPRSFGGIGRNPETIAFKFHDGWDIAAGAEYRWDEALTMRGGLAYEIAPVDDANRLPSLPDGDRFWVSAGATYAFNDRFSVDFGYSHAFVNTASIRQTVKATPLPPFDARVALVAKVKSRVDIVSLGFNYKFGGDAAQQMPDAVLKP